ncbi:MAG: hypothetical protein ACREMW_13855 [Gemmatimonadales bacterium]
MSQSESPLNRSIGLTGVIRWLIAAFAVFAVGAAFAEGYHALAIARTVFPRRRGDAQLSGLASASRSRCRSGPAAALLK